MPGGRLTDQDRRHIAEGLAEGLTYSEIARRLARPTSTVSREVSRNGGSGGYQADQAHRATVGRASRGRQSPSLPPSVAAPAAHGRDPEAVHDFGERLTELMIQAGLPRMTARVMACLYITDSGALTAAELVQRLRVSPASISKAIGELEGQELVRRERDPRGRRDRYVIDDDVWIRAWLASARQNATLADEARRGAEVLGGATRAGARLENMSQFLGDVSRSMIQAAEHRLRASPDRPPAG